MNPMLTKSVAFTLWRSKGGGQGGARALGAGFLGGAKSAERAFFLGHDICLVYMSIRAVSALSARGLVCLYTRGRETGLAISFWGAKRSLCDGMS